MPSHEPDTLLLAKFYGLPKIHKKETPLRPITATVGSPGYLLAKVFNIMLTNIFPRSQYHIRDTYEFVEFIGDIELKENEILVSFDVVSMYTNIPFDLVYDIIMSKAEEFYAQFALGRRVLSRILKFLLCECMYFTALDGIYKQTEGLPMGSCISTLIARLVMDEVIKKLYQEIPQINFIRVFVDDTITAIDGNLVNRALETLNDFRRGQLKFTKEIENVEKSINFLNISLKREEKHICTNWYRKSFASGRLLNFFSAHKRTTVLSTAIHFIKTVLCLSDPKYFHENKDKITRTLRENSFPETLIMVLMQDSYTYMKPLYNDKTTTNKNAEEEEETEYVVFPHAIRESRKIKGIIHRYKKPNIVLSDSTKNTKMKFITSKKTITPIERRKNLILTSGCICKQRYRITRTKKNEFGEKAANRIITNMEECNASKHTFKEVEYHRGLAYNSQTGYLTKYYHWKYRKQLDRDFEYEFPSAFMHKLM